VLSEALDRSLEPVDIAPYSGALFIIPVGAAFAGGETAFGTAAAAGVSQVVTAPCDARPAAESALAV